MLDNITSYIWPTVGHHPDENLQADCDKVNSAVWAGELSPVLDEARRLRDVENARSNIASSTAQIYLAGLLAFIPIVLTMLDFEYVEKRFAAINFAEFIAITLLVLASAYWIGAFWNALKVSNIRAYNRIDVSDLVEIANSASSKSDIIKELLVSVRCDRTIINEKVAHVRVAQMHLSRMTTMFISSLCSFLLVSPIWALASTSGEMIRAKFCG